MEIEFFTQGRDDKCNEDSFDYDHNNIAIVDGVTDKSGNLFNGLTSGEIISKFCVKEILNSKLNGKNLVVEINRKISRLYDRMQVKSNMNLPVNRFMCGFISVRLYKKNIKITYLGDLGFRLNGQFIYKETKKIDFIISKIRSDYIRKTGDIEGARNFILPYLIKQLKYANNDFSKYGYGILDGTNTPTRFIKTFQFYRGDISSLELFTDGYLAIPDQVSIKSWENLNQKINLIDPLKCKSYLSTKTQDDRTIILINFK